MERIHSITYESIPFKAFYHCLYDDSLISEYQIDPEAWKAIKEKWQKENPIQSEQFEEAKKLFSKTAKVNLLKACLTRYLIDQDCEEIFKEVGIPWVENQKEFLEKQIAKETKLCEIINAKLGKMEQPEKAEFSFDRLNESIASLELHGFTIPDYDSLTLSKYEAMSKIIERRGRQNKG